MSRCSGPGCPMACRRRRSTAPRPGRWVGETDWPSPRIEERTWGFDADGFLAPGVPAEGPGPEVSDASMDWASPQLTGLVGGEWCPYGTGGKGPEFPGDQREDDGRSLTFDSEPLPERLEILGAPVVELALEVDRPEAFVAVRLCDVAPDGPSTRASFGILNLSHRGRPRAPAGDDARGADAGPRPAERHGLRVPAGPPRSGSPSRRPTGRWSGRRPSRSPSRSTRPRRP